MYGMRRSSPYRRLNGTRVSKLLPLVEEVLENRNRRIGTGELNRFFEECNTRYLANSNPGKLFKPKYITQISVGPPTFVIFSGGKLRPPARYFHILEARLREEYEFEGTPIVILARQGKGKDPHPESRTGKAAQSQDRGAIAPTVSPVCQFRPESPYL